MKSARLAAAVGLVAATAPPTVGAATAVLWLDGLGLLGTARAARRSAAPGAN